MVITLVGRVPPRHSAWHQRPVLRCAYAASSSATPTSSCSAAGAASAAAPVVEVAAAVRPSPVSSPASAPPPVIWSPGAKAAESQTDRLVGKIGALCKKYGSGFVLGSKGELATARAVRALAKASENRKSPLEFRVEWHVDPSEVPGNTSRSLRFHAELRYTWSHFRRRWDLLSLSKKAESKVLPVTPHTDVSRLATALATEERKAGRAALKLNPSSDAVLNVAAKALATLPHLQPQANTKGPELVCVMRWPATGDALWVYAHLFRRSESLEISEKPLRPSLFEEWARRNIS